jgi:prepilin-type N-terminal cleavage/methylation domain-containing protein
MKKIKRNGFTLFEMLVVISIIAIMTATISLSFSSAQKKARDAKRMEDIKAIATAAEQMYSLSGFTYPPSASAWTTNGQKILSVWPVGPKGDSYIYTPNYSGAGTFCICADMENNEAPTSNSGGNCGNFGTANGYYCAINQQ